MMLVCVPQKLFAKPAHLDVPNNQTKINYHPPGHQTILRDVLMAIRIVMALILKQKHPA